MRRHDCAHLADCLSDAPLVPSSPRWPPVPAFSLKLASHRPGRFNAASDPSPSAAAWLMGAVCATVESILKNYTFACARIGGLTFTGQRRDATTPVRGLAVPTPSGRIRAAAPLIKLANCRSTAAAARRSILGSIAYPGSQPRVSDWRHASSGARRASPDCSAFAGGCFVFETHGGLLFRLTPARVADFGCFVFAAHCSVFDTTRAHRAERERNPGPATVPFLQTAVPFLMTPAPIGLMIRVRASGFRLRALRFGAQVGGKVRRCGVLRPFRFCSLLFRFLVQAEALFRLQSGLSCAGAKSSRSASAGSPSCARMPCWKSLAEPASRFNSRAFSSVSTQPAVNELSGCAAISALITAVLSR